MESILPNKITLFFQTLAGFLFFGFIINTITHLVSAWDRRSVFGFALAGTTIGTFLTHSSIQNSIFFLIMMTIAAIVFIEWMIFERYQHRDPMIEKMKRRMEV